MTERRLDTGRAPTPAGGRVRVQPSIPAESRGRKRGGGAAHLVPIAAACCSPCSSSVGAGGSLRSRPDPYRRHQRPDSSHRLDPHSHHRLRHRAEVVGLCVKRRGQEVEFVRCLGRSDDAVVVGVTPVLIDTVGGPRFGPHCPPATDEVVPAHLPSGETTLLCLGTKPGNGNTRT